MDQRPVWAVPAARRRDVDVSLKRPRDVDPVRDGGRRPAKHPVGMLLLQPARKEQRALVRLEPLPAPRAHIEPAGRRDHRPGSDPPLERAIDARGSSPPQNEATPALLRLRKQFGNLSPTVTTHATPSRRPPFFLDYHNEVYFYDAVFNS